VPRAVIVTVGDELLLGETVDSNAAWLGRELGAMGVNVVRCVTVGDVVVDIQEAVAGGLTAADVVVVTGGLGPTRDDRTRPAVADLLGVTLLLDDGLMEALRERFRRRGYPELPEPNRTQAMVPAGARVLPNHLGTAPGLLLASRGRWVALLPGVPPEMKAIVRGGLKEALVEALGPRLRPVRHRVLRTTGIAESELARRVEEILPEDLGSVSVAFLPDLRGVDLRLTARGLAPEEARDRLDVVEALLRPVVDPYAYESAGGDLAEAVTEALRRGGHALALAESCTGGLVAKRMTDPPGASAVVRGGVVAYSNEAKVVLLGVAPDLLERDGAVSEAVARAMASGVRERFDASVGVGVTGVAGPGGGTESKPVGLVWLAADVRGEVSAESVMLVGDREAIRERAAQAALALLLKLLERGP
jgi:nicotinamide-nucleotide amidase